ncbi:hypothetical protein [Endozoicomonas sp. GU-1]|uniref:hypothetical protein n=1 Tax=Endozoicomonas sp. GU-1 TaxID=3009078 RepID=UPI0022B34762|nr:hypothetical protein [Endozoicomonas sp. GU-1]WBA83135.1 hypothetical protein O2T12_08470 [Endozoicomonas sp. GU-1]WBA86059.1 hypothetical protein O3276_23095 [Endozoicomonas sp. GU-1]
MRSVAGYAFNQVMTSPYIDGVAPGLKTLLSFAVFYHQLQLAGATCPSDEFSCNNSQCISDKDQVCNGVDNCGDNSDEGENLCTEDTCKELGREFRCPKSKECINFNKVCDGIYSDKEYYPYNHCLDRSDEGPKTCTQDRCEKLERSFLCKNKKCIEPKYVCDGAIDGYDNCGDESDEGEKLCTQAKCDELGRSILCGNRSRPICISRRMQCDGKDQCRDGSYEGANFCTKARCEELGRSFLCGKNKKCIETKFVCKKDFCDLYRDYYNYCDDNSDEGADLCTQAKCEELGRDFRCDSSKCIPRDKVCDGNFDCCDHSDEQANLCNTDAPPAYGWLALPAVLTIAAYGVCTYKSYKTLRQANPDSSTTLLLLNALRHPLQFRQPHHQPAVPAQPPTGSGRVLGRQNV